jgi:hypothetical protein
VSAALLAVLSADVAVRRASVRVCCAAPAVVRPRRVAAARLAAALRCAGVRLRWAVERLVERLRLAVERVPVELELLRRVLLVPLRRVLPVLLRRVLLVVLRRVVPRLFWVAIGGDPSSASVRLDSRCRFSGGLRIKEITSNELRVSIAANKRS